MASHRRPKQPSRARVTVLTTAAAAAVAISSQAANAAPSEKPSKDEVKAKVHKLYEDAGRATDKLNGAEEKQEKLEKEISAIQDNVAKGQEELNELREGIGLAASAQYRSGGIDSSIQLFLSADPDDYLDKAATLDQLTSQQVDALKKIQDKQRALAQQRQEATEKLEDLADTRETLAKKKKEVQNKLAAANRLLNSLTAAEKASLDEQETRASRDAGDRVDLGKEAPASSWGAAALAAADTQLGKPYVSGGSGPQLLRLLRADPVGVRPGRCVDQPDHVHAAERRYEDRPRPAHAGRPGVLQQPRPRRPLRGQRHRHPRPVPGQGRPLRVDGHHRFLPVRCPRRRLTPPRLREQGRLSRKVTAGPVFLQDQDTVPPERANSRTTC